MWVEGAGWVGQGGAWDAEEVEEEGGKGEGRGEVAGEAQVLVRGL